MEERNGNDRRQRRAEQSRAHAGSQRARLLDWCSPSNQHQLGQSEGLPRGLTPGRRRHTLLLFVVASRTRFCRRLRACSRRSRDAAMELPACVSQMCLLSAPPLSQSHRETAFSRPIMQPSSLGQSHGYAAFFSMPLPSANGCIQANHSLRLSGCLQARPNPRALPLVQPVWCLPSSALASPRRVEDASPEMMKNGRSTRGGRLSERADGLTTTTGGRAACLRSPSPSLCCPIAVAIAGGISSPDCTQSAYISGTAAIVVALHTSHRLLAGTPLARGGGENFGGGAQVTVVVSFEKPSANTCCLAACSLVDEATSLILTIAFLC